MKKLLSKKFIMALIATGLFLFSIIYLKQVNTYIAIGWLAYSVMWVVGQSAIDALVEFAKLKIKEKIDAS